MRVMVVLFALWTLTVTCVASAATMVGVYDPTGQSPQQIEWPPYPAEPPAGFHWQETGSPAIRLDPTTRQPVAGQFTGSRILVRDGYAMPKILRGRIGPVQRQ